jgi:hypothetical protein
MLCRSELARDGATLREQARSYKTGAPLARGHLLNATIEKLQSLS